MSSLEIYTWPAKVLETKAKDVTVFDDELKNFVADMHETMIKARGIGLAANQVGSLKRVITIFIPHERDSGETQKDWHDKKLTFINPVFSSRSKEITGIQESCLSLPGVSEYIDRNDTITVEAYDVDGNKFSMDADDILSICLQHEVDHLDGITFLKRMSRLKSGLAKKRLLKNPIGKYKP